MLIIYFSYSKNNFHILCEHQKHVKCVILVDQFTLITCATVYILITMVLLDKSKFLEELNILFNTSQSCGSVRITMKLLLLNKEPKNPKPKIEVPKEKICLIRATFKNKKLSTRVSANEVTSFQEEYCSLLRNSLSSLKKTKKIKKKAMS